MKQNVSLILLAVAVAMGFSGCAGETETKPAGPVSDTGTIPWNAPIAGQGQGQLGQLPQSKYYR